MRTAIILLALAIPLASDSAAEENAKFYDPIERTIEGWTVKIDPKLNDPENRAVAEQTLKALANHLQRITYIVPPERVEQLRKLPIWVDWEHELANMQYHPNRGWLLANGYDSRLVKHVHIPRAKNLLDPQQWAKHPYVVLHELADAYHDQVLSFDEPTIIEAFKQMKEEGIYQEVLLYTGRKVKHYGLTNHKEYFAESTEAYFGVNDFYPFVRAELKEHDPRMFAVMQRVWGKIR
ncbi:MAG: metallopeptidase [Pirellulales bacterium]|nr:metallopeptidase [Pirellulales bacterium]